MILTFFVDYRKRTLAQFEVLQEENRVVRASLGEYRDAAESVLEVIYPGHYLRANPSTRLADLKRPPRKLKRIIKDAATATATQAMVLMKSHYPRLDLQRFEEGYAADADDDKVDALMSEVQPFAESFMADLEVDGKPLVAEGESLDSS